MTEPHTSSTYTASNRDHFNQLAKSYQAPRSSIELAKRAANAILQHYNFDEDSTEVIDFACGSGLLSQHLAPHTKSIVGVDISQGMVDLYNASAVNQGLLPEELKAVCVDILSEGIQEEDPFGGQRFDLVVCASAYHHFQSIDDATKRLVSYLKEDGGILMVVDLIYSESLVDCLDEIFPEHQDGIVAHRGGLKSEAVIHVFQNAGLEDVEFQPAINVKKKGHSLELFLAKGRRVKKDIVQS